MPCLGCLHVQIPDIYDSAKYDANHNHHLNLDLRVRGVCLWGTVLFFGYAHTHNRTHAMCKPALLL